MKEDMYTAEDKVLTELVVVADVVGRLLAFLEILEGTRERSRLCSIVRRRILKSKSIDMHMGLRRVLL
jgi:hypothetical protein